MTSPSNDDEGSVEHLIERFDRRSERPLEPHELKELRAMLEEYKWSKRTWRFFARLSAWIFGVIAALYAGRDMLARVLRAIFAP